MKRQQQSVLMAGLVAMVLAGCSSTGADVSADSAAFMDRDSVEIGNDPSATGPSTTPATPGPASRTTPDSASMGNSTTGATDSSISEQSGTAMGTANQAATGTGTPASAAPNSTVTSIEVVPRQDGVTGAGTVAGAAVGGALGTGATGAPATGERVYRITLRTDDGSTQVVTQEWMPTFSSGDRVRVNSGVIQR